MIMRASWLIAYLIKQENIIGVSLLNSCEKQPIFWIQSVTRVCGFDVRKKKNS